MPNMWTWREYVVRGICGRDEGRRKIRKEGWGRLSVLYTICGADVADHVD